MDSRRLLASPVLARALCTPARTPKSIARIAITAISVPIFATCAMFPTAMPLSMMDAVRYGLRISRMTQHTVYSGEISASFLIPFDFLRNARAGDMLFCAGRFCFSH